jgi:Putative sensor
MVAAGPAGDAAAMNAHAIATRPRAVGIARRWAADAAFHALGLLTSIVGFTLWMTGATVSVSLLIVWVGVPLTVATLIACRWFGDAERWRAGLAGFVSFPLATVAVAAWSTVAGMITLPAWYWSLPDGTELGLMHGDTLPKALLIAAIGLAAVPLCGYLVRALTIAELWVMRPLLTPRA